MIGLQELAADVYTALSATAPLELAANVFTAVAIVLAGRNNIHTWWTGVVGTLLFGLLFAQNRLYADVALQLFFVVTGLIGWWKWLRGRHGEALPVTHAGMASMLRILPLGVGATAAYGAMLHHFTNAYAPFPDSAVLYAGFWINALVSWRNWHKLAALPSTDSIPTESIRP
jgi:nicotinamide mononucleotide transporter